MNKSTLIKLVQGSKQTEISLEETRNLLESYQELTQLTGQQLAWDYTHAAFPYTIEERTENNYTYLLLKGNNDLYHYLMIGVGKEQDTEVPYIQIVLPENGTQGDQSKANELAKFLAKQLKGELHLFNGRVLYMNDRK